MDFERRNAGTGHSYWLTDDDGVRVKLDGVTTVIGDGMRKRGLESWAGDATAAAAVDRWDELAALPLSERFKILTKARYDTRDAAALRGTQIHALAERLVAGEDVHVPEEHLGPVQALARFLDLWRVLPVLREGPVFHVKHGWAGTPDLLADINGTGWLLDWKTGKGLYEDVALQLAAYNHATHVQTSEGIREWIPAQRCGAVHITPDSAELHEVDASDDTYLAFRYVQQVAHWAGRARRAYLDGAPWPVGVALHPAGT